MESISSRNPTYGDFTTLDDFQTAQNQIAEANSQFAELPSRIRERFSNSPKALVAFLSDETNLLEAVELGLVAAPPSEPEPEPAGLSTTTPEAHIPGVTPDPEPPSS